MGEGSLPARIFWALNNWAPLDAASPPSRCGRASNYLAHYGGGDESHLWRPLSPPNSDLRDSGASGACAGSASQAVDLAPAALLTVVRNACGPLQCFRGKIGTFVTVPGSLPARDLGYTRDWPAVCVTQRGGTSSAVCGMPGAGVFWKQYRAVRPGLLRARQRRRRRGPDPRRPPPAAVR